MTDNKAIRALIIRNYTKKKTSSSSNGIYVLIISNRSSSRVPGQSTMDLVQTIELLFTILDAFVLTKTIKCSLIFHFNY